MGIMEEKDFTRLLTEQTEEIKRHEKMLLPFDRAIFKETAKKLYLKKITHPMIQG